MSSVSRVVYSGHVTSSDSTCQTVHTQGTQKKAWATHPWVEGSRLAVHTLYSRRPGRFLRAGRACAQRLANACLRIVRDNLVLLTTPAPSLTRFTHGSKWFRRMAPTISQNVRRCSCSSKRDGRRSMGKSRLTQCNGSAHAHRGLTHNGQGVPTLRGMA